MSNNADKLTHGFPVYKREQGNVEFRDVFDLKDFWPFGPTQEEEWLEGYDALIHGKLIEKDEFVPNYNSSNNQSGLADLAPLGSTQMSHRDVTSGLWGKIGDPPLINTPSKPWQPEYVGMINGIQLIYPTEYTSIGGKWGAPREDHLHQGVDVYNREGEPIYAIAVGEVSKIVFTDQGTGGIRIKIDHYWQPIKPGDKVSFTSYYMHNSKIADSMYVGKLVMQGEVIAYVGRTGNAKNTSPHIHFEIHDMINGVETPVPVENYYTYW